MSRVRPPAAALLALLAVLVLLAAPPPARAEAPWESELRREAEEQDAAIEQARRGKTMPAVVQRYASRVSRTPTAVNHYLLGRALYYSEDAGGARAQMNAALEADRGFWPAHLRLAMLAEQSKAYAQAERHLAEVFAKAPKDAEARLLAAGIAVARSDWAGAAQHLSVRLGDDPSDLDTRRRLGWVQLQRKDYAGAARELEAVRARQPGDGFARRHLAEAWVGLGRIDDAVAMLEEAARKDPHDVLALDGLRGLYARKNDLAGLERTLERMLPLLPADRQKVVVQALEAIRAAKSGGGGAPPAPTGPRPPTLSDLAAEATSTDVGKRRDAMRVVYEACQAGYVKQLPGEFVRRFERSVEPDVECRCWAVKMLGLLPKGIVWLALALSDESPDVRMLAQEALGDAGRPAAYAYLRPYVLDPTLSVDELNVVRASMSRITGFSDLPSGVDRVRTPEEAAAVREAWRRWSLSDASTEVKLAAIRDVVALAPVQPERLLVDFVFDPTFAVMREGYLALRDATARTPEFPIDKKMLPLFPRRADAEVTRATQREIQERVAAWWQQWLAERRAAISTR